MKHLLLLLTIVLVSSGRVLAEKEVARNGGQVFGAGLPLGADQPVMGEPGTVARYRIQKPVAAASTVTTYAIVLGKCENVGSAPHQWLHLEAVKADGRPFHVWLLSAGYPPQTIAGARTTIARYILQEAGAEPLEFRHEFTGAAVLPSLGGWQHLMPRAVPEADETPPDEVLPKVATYLGHHYQREGLEHATTALEPPDSRVVRLLPDVLVGLPHNTRQRDETRRFDDSDYELVRLTREDFQEMIAAGLNCLNVDAEQAEWIRQSNVFHYGVGGDAVSYPECLYHSQYLGPTLYLDEPAVVTRDSVIRPRLAADQAFRRALTPQMALSAFQEHFRHVNHQGPPTALLAGLAARPDVDLGDMKFLQQNIHSWETMVSSAAFQLSEHSDTPCAMVFEPPGRVGTLRTLPEMNMTYGCQIPVDSPKNLIDILFGFLRGAARLTDKDWGTSVYGQVHRADAFWFLTHAYDLGATRFFFWDSYRLACVPYSECLALARNLRAHAEGHPHRDLQRLKQAAEVAILLPPGYNLGHVHMGKGSLWGLDELNLERTNSKGVKYRVVMGNFFTEIERCLRLGVAFDLFWDLPEIRPVALDGTRSPDRACTLQPPAWLRSGPALSYREVIRIREDGKVQISRPGNQVLIDSARTPARPAGSPPRLTVALSVQGGRAPLAVSARADIVEQSAAVYYTFGADIAGVYHNALAAWELYGPGEEDYRFLQPKDLRPRVERRDNGTEVAVDFTLDRPGTYRLRTATVDMAGRTAVVWNDIRVTQ